MAVCGGINQKEQIMDKNLRLALEKLQQRMEEIASRKSKKDAGISQIMALDAAKRVAKDVSGTIQELLRDFK